MKKIAAYLISFLLVSMAIITAFPINVSAAVPNLSVSFKTSIAFTEGSVILPINIVNNEENPVTISSIECMTSNFSFTAQTNLKTSVLNKGNADFSIPAAYDGLGKILKLRIKLNNFSEYYTTTLTANDAVVTPSDGKPELKPDTTSPKLYVYSTSTTSVAAGEVSPFNFKIGNKGTRYANNARIRIEAKDDTTNLFSFDSSTGWINVSYIYIGTSQNIATSLRVSPLVKDGTYKLNVIFSADDMEDQVDSINVSVQGKSNAAPYITTANLDKKEIGKENKAKLTVKLYNPTASTVYDMRMSLNIEGSPGFTLYENFKPVTEDSIGSGASSSKVFSMYISSATLTGNYPVTFDVSYKSSDGIINTTKEVVYVEVKRTADANNGADGTTGTPRIIISNYSTDVKDIKAGQTLDFTLQNTSSKTGVSNIKVVLGSAQSTAPAGTQGSGGDVFFPVAGSNSFFIEKLGAKKTVSNKIKLMARQDVEPGVYPVLLDLEYEDDSAKPFKSQENIAFAVGQEQRLDITGLNIPADSPMGPIPLSFQYINKGKATIYNFSVNVEGDFTLDGGNLYVGNLTAGFNDTFDSTLMPKGEGQQKGVIVLKYENSKGEPQEQRTEISVNVMPMDNGGGINPDGGLIDPNTGELVKPKKGFPIVWTIIISLVVLAGAGVPTFLILKKKSKAKKELMLDEED